ncbi:MAG: class I SAM-dependent methyltransferase [Acidobacteria bacterium]|nr:class I SAM-dependent methyltransferase [Acidobacteriota bacterium]
MATKTRADYGIDAPKVLLRFVIIGVVGLLAASILFYTGLTKRSALAVSFENTFLWGGLSCLLTAAVMFWGSKRGKLSLRDRVINSIEWRGDERVLDVGCGHGLMLIAAAKRLTSGRAVGIDLWQKEDQAGNSREATLENARLEGVAERVELRDGDARELPFADDSFDIILSSWALHNIYEKEGRARAIKEIARVLKPGGQVRIVDISHTKEYADTLRASGMQEVKLSSPNFIFVIPTRTLTAIK